MDRSKRAPKGPWRAPVWAPAAAYFLVEAFAFAFLKETDGSAWPLAFGALWAVILGALALALPPKGGRILFGVSFFALLVYSGGQTGYYLMFRQMLWLSEFRYASEGSAFFEVLLRYPLGWWLSLGALAALGAVTVARFPGRRRSWQWRLGSLLTAVAAAVGCVCLPTAVFQHDRQIQYAGSDYGRAQSAQAAYENMFNTHRLYEVCGLTQTLAKDVYRAWIEPITPGYARKLAQGVEEINGYFSSRKEGETNQMTGIFQGKNVIFVLMESMDDFSLGEHTPTLNRLMEEGICFTDFYTPGYGGVRTFNSEFCSNTGSFLSTTGGYAFDYVTNDFRQSLAGVLGELGYNSRVYHYNSPDFYSRGVFSPAMGYEKYVCYEDYITQDQELELYSDTFLFDYPQVAEDFFREGRTLNYIITRSAHLSYKYNEMLSWWALKKYPEFRGLTGDEELDCLYLKAKLVDDLFARLLQELEARGQLENTVIVAMTDHYAYGFKNVPLMLEKSGVGEELLLEKTPCFIWSPGGPELEVDKTLQTVDLLPTVLNLMGVERKYPYMGRDAFDDSYQGYALFPDGSWICQGVAYSAGTGKHVLMKPGAQWSETLQQEMAGVVNTFIRVNNLILETDYYRR